MIKKIPGGQFHHRVTKVRQLGLQIENGEYDVNDLGAVLLVRGNTKEGKKRLKAGTTYNISLPHEIKVVRNAIVVSLPPEIAAACSSYSIPTFLHVGWEGKLEVSLTIKENDIDVSELIQLSIVEISY